MTQQQLLQTFLPILILLPVLYLRMRRMAGTRPLKLNRLWIQPAIILALAALALLAPQPHHVVRHFVAMDWAWRWSRRWRRCMAARRCWPRPWAKAPA